MEKPGFTQISNVKVMINIGAGLDIPTGFYVKGFYGENILLGGLGMVTGVVGIGNSFKSTIMHYMMLSAADRITSSVETSMSTYDTEVNIHEERLNQYSRKFYNFKDRDIINDGTWVITDKTIYYADKWFTKLKEYLDSKFSNAKKYMVETPFMSRDKTTPINIIIPTFTEIDSFSEFETSDVAKIQDENELGDSGGNTIHMRQGLGKTRFLMEIPNLAGTNNHYFLMTAHVGKDMNMASGPYAPPPTKKLQHLKHGDKIKGVTDKFFFLLSNCWHVFNTAPLINQSTKGPEYPKNSDENMQGDLDLHVASMRQLRSKSGPSGSIIDLVVSQTEGVLPSLTEFHYIKTEDRFGLSGTLHSYSLDIYPDVKLSRTTIRSKIDNDDKLKRALNITSELCQMHQYFKTNREVLCTPKELYDDLVKLGYDWDFILTKTRGWWAINDKHHPLKFLSTMDLLNIRAGIYKIYWLEDDKKTIKKEYL